MLPSAADNAAVSAKLAEAKRCTTASGSNTAEIRRHYNDGSTHYHLEEYPQAIAEFKLIYADDVIYRDVAARINAYYTK